jgi:crotonobetainyl-CoA:carnitine CoA-transferase CaiB-like acyl-CoA transferase
LVEATHPQTGRFRTVRSPVSFDGQRSLEVKPPPLLGEHDAEVDAQMRARAAR